MPKTVFFLLIALIFLCSSPPAASQESPPAAATAQEVEFTGVVVDSQGAPVSDVSVALWPNTAAGPTALTGDDGRFAFEIPASTAELTQGMVVFFARHGKLSLAGFSEAHLSTPHVNITLSPAPTLVGEVLDFGADPIEGARVTLYHQDGRATGQVGADAVCAADGRFHIPAVPPSPTQYFLLSVYAPRFGLRQGPIRLPENSNETIDIGGLVLPAADLSVSGIVVDTSDNPVPGATVSAHPYEGAVELFRLPKISTLTAEDGSFTLSGLTESGVRLKVSKADPVFAGNAVVQGGASDVRIIALSQEEQVSQTLDVRQPPPGPASLVGQPLPDLSAFAFQTVPDLDGKIVLVCLFDYQSRPSRHMVAALAPAAPDLAAKGVALLLVHAGSADAETLRTWAAGNAPGVPLGISSATPDEIQAAWCAEGLPWLILFDASRTARFEGFPAGDLDEKLEQLSAE